MQIAILTYLYPETVDYVDKLFPSLHEQNYDNQKKVIDNHISIWASSWEKALEEQKVPVRTIPTNIPLFFKSSYRRGIMMIRSLFFISLPNNFKK